jgi:hypothetical protein
VKTRSLTQAKLTEARARILEMLETPGAEIYTSKNYRTAHRSYHISGIYKCVTIPGPMYDALRTARY